MWEGAWPPRARSFPFVLSLRGAIVTDERETARPGRVHGGRFRATLADRGVRRSASPGRPYRRTTRTRRCAENRQTAHGPVPHFLGPIQNVKAPTKDQGQNAARSERGQALGQTPEGLTPLLGDRPQVYPDKSRACEEKPPQFLASF